MDWEVLLIIAGLMIVMGWWNGEGFFGSIFETGKGIFHTMMVLGIPLLVGVIIMVLLDFIGFELSLLGKIAVVIFGMFLGGAYIDKFGDN